MDDPRSVYRINCSAAKIGETWNFYLKWTWKENRLDERIGSNGALKKVAELFRKAWPLAKYDYLDGVIDLRETEKTPILGRTDRTRWSPSHFLVCEVQIGKDIQLLSWNLSPLETRFCFWADHNHSTHWFPNSQNQDRIDNREWDQKCPLPNVCRLMHPTTTNRWVVHGCHDNF